MWDVPDDQILRSSAAEPWRGLAAAEVVHPLDDFRVPALDRHILVFNLGPPMEANERHSGHTGRLTASGVMLLPAGRERRWHLERTGEIHHLHVYVDPHLLQTTAEAVGIGPDRVEIFEAYGAQDPLLGHLGDAIRRELREGGLGGPLYVDSLGTALAVHLLRRYSTTTPRAPSVDRGLPRPLLRRAVQHIDEHLSDELRLDEIARAVHLSPYHFARLFKASTGLPVHQYVIRRRVGRAEELLRSTTWTLDVIAEQVGFAHGSHLAYHFRRLLGVRPSQVRRAS